MSGGLLQIENLFVARGGRPLITELSLEIQAGEFVVLMGHNGSGKTTLALAIAGLIPYQAGRVVLDPSCGQPAIVLQDETLFLGRSVAENISAGALGRFRAGHHAGQALRARTEHDFPGLRDLWRRPCNQLSGGQRQLVAIARAAYSQTRLLLLDEPSVGLMAEATEYAFRHLSERVKADGACALVIEHNPAIAAFATRLCVMRAGQLVYDGSPDLLQDRDRLRDVYL